MIHPNVSAEASRSSDQAPSGETGRRRREPSNPQAVGERRGKHGERRRRRGKTAAGKDGGEQSKRNHRSPMEAVRVRDGTAPLLAPGLAPA